ncbi:MAG: hypothetical protein FWF45_02440 [Coriobacteriia bacterium]|nr:hypothetical protein [Coriobacteriia bacterium]
MTPRIAWFKNERGSTSLAVVLAIILSLVLVAGSLQWYWTNSSSEDIQLLADSGALAAADTQSKIMQSIQILDALLLTANLFGLVLHCVVVVAGVVTVVTEGSGAEFFEKAVDFDRSFCEKRKTFAQDIYKLAQGLNEAAPYLVMARSGYAIQQTASSIKSFSGGSYAGVAVPFPFKGEVELTGYSEGEDKLLTDVEEAHDTNEQDATEAQAAQKEADDARAECFRLDVYKAAGTSEFSWDPSYAYDDFKQGFSGLVSDPTPTPPALTPIDDNANTRATLQVNYEKNYLEIRTQLQTAVPGVIGTAHPASDDYPATDLDKDTLLQRWLGEQVFVLVTPAGQRRAYHHSTDCFGLAGAQGTPEQVRLETLIGASEHPPCTICMPTDWRALQQWEQKLQPFITQWNAEAAALRRYRRAREKLSEKEDSIRETSTSAIGKVLEHAGSYLLGGRLRYRSSGARGFVCVVVNTQERGLPAFTLPPLTNAQGSRLAPQVALSGAKLLPSAALKTLPSLLSQSGDQAHGTGDSGLGGATRALLGADDPGGGGSSSGVFSFVLSLWGSCLDVYGRGANGLGDQLAGLPFGLDGVVKPAFDKLLAVAQASPPDLRYPQPILVDTAAVGSPDAEGFEGGFVSALRAAKQGFAKLGSSELLATIKELTSGAGDVPDLGDLVKAVEAKVLGVDLGLPFGEQAKTWLPDVRRQLEEIGSL